MNFTGKTSWHRSPITSRGNKLLFQHFRTNVHTRALVLIVFSVRVRLTCVHADTCLCRASITWIHPSLVCQREAGQKQEIFSLFYFFYLLLSLHSYENTFKHTAHFFLRTPSVYFTLDLIKQRLYSAAVAVYIRVHSVWCTYSCITHSAN